MKIEKVLEVLNEALSDKDMCIWVRDEQIRTLQKEVEELREENKHLNDLLDSANNECEQSHCSLDL